MPWVGSLPSSEITFDAIVDELRARAPELTQARAVRLVNWRLARMVGEADYKRKVTVLTTTVADQAVYDLPSESIDVRRAWVGDGRYERVTYEDILDLTNDRVSLTDSTVTGVFAPYDSSDGDPQLMFWPAPDEDGLDVSVEESVQSSDLAYGAGATTILPVHLVPRLLDGALADAYEASARFDLAEYHEQRFVDGVDLLRRHKNSRVGSGPVRIRLTR